MSGGHGNDTMMRSAPSRLPTSPTSNLWPPELFEEITDLLAELVLDDMRQFPTLADLQAIDTRVYEENTAVVFSKGGS